MDTKVCSKCHEEKETNEFHIDNGKRDGFYSWCKKCIHEHHAKQHHDKRQQILSETKVCKKCGVEKELREFLGDKNCRNGRRGECKQCKRESHGKPSSYEFVGEKICSHCREKKQISEFHKNSWSRDGYNQPCKACISRQHGATRHARYDRHLKAKHGLENGEYDKMVERQGGVCAICKQNQTTKDHRTHETKRLGVDHNHTTGKVRELLCDRCNRIIGWVNEDTVILECMIDYLKRHSE